MDPRKILLIDDSRTVTRVVQTALEGEGYGVRCAFNGEDALLYLEGHKPDLIILDVVMPQMSGWDVLRKLKESPKTSAIPVILLTVNGQHEDVMEGYKLGAAYYIIKPFKPAELIHGIQLVLGRGDRPGRTGEEKASRAGSVVPGR